MKKILMALMVVALAACSFPNTPGEGNLLNGSKQHRTELFQTGARGQIVLSLSDNVSEDGFFGKNYDKIIAFKNLQTGEVYNMSTEDAGYDTAMLPIGEYEVTNLFLQYVYTTTQRQGNMTVTTTHIETIEHFEGNHKIRFTVKAGEVTYIGNIKMVKAENKVNPDGSYSKNSFAITDKSAEIPNKQKDKWKKEFGKNYVVRLAAVK